MPSGKERAEAEAPQVTEPAAPEVESEERPRPRGAPGTLSDEAIAEQAGISPELVRRYRKRHER